MNDQTKLSIFRFCSTAIDFKEGLARIDVYRKGIPDPVFSIDEGITCTDINNWVPLIRCPIKRGSMETESYFY